MTFGPKRGHILYIFDNVLKDFGLLIVAVILGLIRGDVLETLLNNAFIFGLILVGPVTKIVQYLTMTIEVNEERVLVNSGWLKKVTKDIPSSTITTIDFTQTLIQRAFGVYRMKLDNTSNMAAENDINVKMVLSGRDVETIRTILGQRKEAVDGLNLAAEKDEEVFEEKSRMKISSFNLVKMGLLKSKLTFIIEGIALGFAGFGYLSISVFDGIEAFFEHATGMLLILMILGLMVFLLLLGLATSVITYMDFTVTDKGDRIGIEYGLLTKKSYNLIKSRISGFTYEQSFLMKLMGVGTLKVYAVGFGTDLEDKGENGIIHPYIKESEVKDFMNQYISGFECEYEMRKAADHSLKYFFYRVSMVLSVIILAGTIGAAVATGLYWLIFIGAAIVVISVVEKIMEYRGAACGGDEKTFTVVNGGFGKTTSYIRTDNVESITQKTSIWKRKRGIQDIKVDFLGDFAETSAVAYSMEQDVYEKLLGYLTF